MESKEHQVQNSNRKGMSDELTLPIAPGQNWSQQCCLLKGHLSKQPRLLCYEVLVVSSLCFGWLYLKVLAAMLRFTYICPLTDTVYMPQYSIALPADTTCDVDHNVAAERNKFWAQSFPVTFETSVTNASWNPCLGPTKAILDLWNNDLRLYLTIPTGLKAKSTTLFDICWGMHA